MGSTANFRDIESLVKEGRLDEACDKLAVMIAALEGCADECGPAKLAEAYFIRGKIAWRQGRRADAQNDYARATALDRSSPAAVALEQARDVEAFFNHDLYNP